MAGSLIIQSDKEPSWIKWIKNRIAKHKNAIILVFGATGSGKSWTCLSMAYMLDKNFNSSRILFGLKPLMELVNSDEGKDFGPLTPFILEEFQTYGNARTWASTENKAINAFVSTFRHRRWVLFINLPYPDMMDSATRKLLHAEFEVLGVDEELQKTILKPMVLQYNPRFKKQFYKYLRLKTDRGIIPLKRWKVARPPQWLIDEYEIKKKEFTENLNKYILAELKKHEIKKISDSRKPLTARQEEVLNFLAQAKGNVEEASKISGIKLPTIYFHRSLASNKGYSWEDFAENGGKTAKE